VKIEPGRAQLAGVRTEKVTRQRLKPQIRATGAVAVDDSSTTASCGGADNTMFWLITAQAQGLFSPQQSRIIRANPVVY